jgi:Fic family protein
VDLDAGLVYLLSEADRALGTLDGIGRTLPNPYLLISPFLSREAVASSRIEGTQASLSDLFLFEASQEKALTPRDVREVANYVKAANHGVARLDELPLGLRLVRELHATLLEGVRGRDQSPGQFRTVQNWIGQPPTYALEDAVYVPPPVRDMADLLDDWEAFLHERLTMPPLVRCALMHYQFESIHPFRDGNGRLGRLLITLYLCAEGHLAQPLLYLSAFFEAKKGEYYDRLQAIRTSGDWSGWLGFFLNAVVGQSRDAVDRSGRILALREEYRERLLQAKGAASPQRLLDALFLSPAVNIRGAQDMLQINYLTALRAVEALVEVGILREVTGGRRNRIFVADELVRAIEEDIPAE